MEVPRGPITPGPGSIMRYVDSKRTKDRIVYCDATSSLLIGNQNAWNVWRLWEVPEEIEALQAMGHEVNVRDRQWGNMHGVLWDRETGEVSGGSDPRSDAGRAIVR